jgi:hypothetical protein
MTRMPRLAWILLLISPALLASNMLVARLAAGCWCSRASARRRKPAWRNR